MKTPIEFLAQHTGKHEKTSRELDKFFDAVGYPKYRTDRTAWCAAAVGWSCIQAGYGNIIEAIPKSDRLMARAWDVHEKKLAKLGVKRVGGKEAITNGLARPGDIVTYTRQGTTRDRSRLVSGHIDFFTTYDASAGKVYGLGGNESNRVRNGSSSINKVLSVYRLPPLSRSKRPKALRRDKLAEMLPHLKESEGGFVNHPKDPGGATNRGITLRTYRTYAKRDATIADLKRMTWDEAVVIYRAHYWDKVRGDDLPPGIDWTVFDFAVNSGPSRAAKHLQAAVSVTQDGAVGPQTMAAVKAANVKNVIKNIAATRLAFLKGLKHWPTFAGGWQKRVKKVREFSLELASRPQPQGDNPMLSIVSMILPLIKFFTGKRMQSGILGALLGALGMGAAGAEGAPIGDIANLDWDALLAGGGAAGLGLKAFVDGIKDYFKEQDEENRAKVPEPISLPMPTDDDDLASVDTSALVQGPMDSGRIQDVLENVAEGKTLDDDKDGFAALLAKIMSNGLKQREDIFEAGAMLGATAQKRYTEGQAKK